MAGEPVDDDARAYELVLPHVERVLTHTSEYESLWRDAWDRIATALDSFAKGASRVEEDGEAKFSLVTLAPEIFSTSGFKPTLHTAPFTAISSQAHGELFLIATFLDNGWAYRIDYPYYSWAETVVRPQIGRRDFASLVGRLNELEKHSASRWKIDSSELSSAVKFADPAGRLAASALGPDVVRSELRTALLQTNSAARASTR